MGDKPHKKLEVWKKGIDLICLVYEITAKFPPSEVYGLALHMRRSIVSVPSNVAEGAARQTKKQFIQFLANSQGSLSELDTQAIAAHKLGYINDDDFLKLETAMDLEDKMLTGLIKSIRKADHTN
jgi:four helix bundle protein